MAEAGDGSGHTPLTPEWTLHPVPLITRGRETDRPPLLQNKQTPVSTKSTESKSKISEGITLHYMKIFNVA